MKLPFVVRDRAIQGNFDQIASALGFTRIVMGTSTASWPGGAAKSNQLVVAHGLGVTPRAFAQCQTQAFIGEHWTFIEDADATNIFIRVQTTGFAPAGTVTARVAWAAFA